MDEVDDNEFEEVDSEDKEIVDENDFEEAAVDGITRKRSLVYTATKDTLFQEDAKDTKTHSLVSKHLGK